MKIKTLIIVLLIPLLTLGQKKNNSEKVHSYTKKSGSTVQSYNRSKANGTEKDNYSSKGNTNPYTGKKGSKAPKK